MNGVKRMAWYDLLITDEFLDFFEQRNGNYAAYSTFQKFSDTVQGITLAFGGYPDSVENHLKTETDVYNAYKSCKKALTDEVTPADIWKSIPLGEKKSPYDVAIDTLTAEQIAVLILYPFWDRMGGSFKTEFAESGKLKLYLHELAKKRSVG